MRKPGPFGSRPLHVGNSGFDDPTRSWPTGHGHFDTDQSVAASALDLISMRKAAIAIALIVAGPGRADPVLRFPNDFEYWRLWDECSEPYLYCDYTTKTCMSGHIVYEHFVGVVVDARKRQTLIAHVRCNANACFNYDTGTLVIGGHPTAYRMEHDRPFTNVEDMRVQRARGCSLDTR
jgi:hypothetical protein